MTATERGAARRWPRVAVFIIWLAVVVALSHDHAVWRDEVRALSFAVQGDNLADMLRQLHGEGHPALWYLLLRATYTVYPEPVVLKLVAVVVAALAAALLLAASPFRLPLVIGILLGKFMLFEYSVMARNYGIGMLLLFIVAAVFERYRDRGVVIGVLLALLANTSVPATLLVAAFLIFWAIETVLAQGLYGTAETRHFALNAGIALFGVLLCAITVYPTFNDAAVLDAGQVVPTRVLLSLLSPAGDFTQSFLSGPWRAFQPEPSVAWSAPALVRWALSLVMFGSILGLVRRPAALVAALAALLSNVLFFTLLYPGAYRHQALWLVFMIVMYWLAAAPSAGRHTLVPARWEPLLKRVAALGFACFVALLALQIPGGIRAIVDAVSGAPPFSRSRDLARLIVTAPELHDAIIVADPDPLVEALPYYVDNPTYLIREARFGRYVRFTTRARLVLNLSDILAAARNIAVWSRRPVLILMRQRLDPAAPAKRWPEGYNWQLVTTPDQVRAFEAVTTRLVRFGPARSNESFDVYRLDSFVSDHEKVN